MTDKDLWIFGYGSLMWRPGFTFEEQAVAHIHGYHRSLCIYSHVHRGTEEQPGLVLGLDRGGSCKGMAFRVSAASVKTTLVYLRGREQATGVYREIHLHAALSDGRRVEALAYAADQTHAQYAGRLDRRDALRLILQGNGISGNNPDYVCNTLNHLRALDIRDDYLEWLVRQLAEDGGKSEGEGNCL